MKEQDLLDLKQEIDEAKTKVSELKGERQYMMKQLQEQWGCANIDAAAKKLEKLRKEEKELQEKIDQGIANLKEKYDV